MFRDRFRAAFVVSAFAAAVVTGVGLFGQSPQEPAQHQKAQHQPDQHQSDSGAPLAPLPREMIELALTRAVTLD